MTRPREGGSASVEFVWLSILLLVPFVYALIAVFDTQRASYAVSAASSSAARAFLRAADPAQAEHHARAAALVALADQDVDADIAITCEPGPAHCLQPGSSVRVVVHAVQPLPLTPSALGDQLGGIAVDSTHTESYGTYRAARR